MPSFGKILTAVLREKCSRTDGRTDGLKIRSLTSTDVENCNGGNHLALRQKLKEKVTMKEVPNT